MLISALWEQHVQGGETLEASTLPLSSTDDPLQSRWFASTNTSTVYCICIQETMCVFFLLIRLFPVASGELNSSSPQGHKSQTHPLSCCSLCHPPWSILSLSLPHPFVFHLCRIKDNKSPLRLDLLSLILGEPYLFPPILMFPCTVAMLCGINPPQQTILGSVIFKYARTLRISVWSVGK